MPDPIIAPPAGSPPAGDPPAAPPAGTPPPGAPPPAGSPPAGDPPASGTPPAGAPPAGEPPLPDWRAQRAGDDPKKLALLSRYASEQAWLDSWFDLRKTVDTTRPKQPLPDNPTPEQIAAWRTDNGIPLEPAGYLDKLPNGLVIGADDKPIFDSFAATLHAKNLPPAAAHAAIEWYNGFAEQQAAATAEADRANATATEDALREEWGPDYRANVNARAAFLESLPEKVRDGFLSARLPDGTLLGEYPEMSQWLVGIAREINPMASVPPGSGVGQGGVSIDDRLGAIKKEMGNQYGQYWKGERGQDGKTALEREYDTLMGIKEKQQQRGAA